MQPRRSIAASGVGIVLMLMGGEGARAEPWARPSGEFLRYGIRTMTCDRAGHAPICLGLACRNGVLELVNAAGGGGPMEGTVRVSAGQRTLTLTFVFDPHAIDRLGLATSRAKLGADQVSVLAEARDITLTDGGDRRIRHRFSSQDQAREWRRVRTSCSVAGADPHRVGDLRALDAGSSA